MYDRDGEGGEGRGWRDEGGEGGEGEREGEGGKGGWRCATKELILTFFYISFSDYKDPKNRISFFKEYAVARGFDPLVPDNWYTIKHREILLANVCPSSSHLPQPTFSNPFQLLSPPFYSLT